MEMDAEPKRFVFVLSQVLAALSPPHNGFDKLLDERDDDIFWAVSPALEGVSTAIIQAILKERARDLARFTGVDDILPRFANVGESINFDNHPIAQLAYESALKGIFPVSAAQLERAALRAGFSNIQVGSVELSEARDVGSVLLHGAESDALQRPIAGGPLVSPVCKCVTWPLLRGILRCFAREHIRPSLDLVLDTCNSAFGIACDVMDIVLAAATAQPGESCKIVAAPWCEDTGQTPQHPADILARKLASAFVVHSECEIINQESFVFPPFSPTSCRTVEVEYLGRRVAPSFEAVQSDLQELHVATHEGLTIPLLIGFVNARRGMQHTGTQGMPSSSSGSGDSHGDVGSVGQFLWVWEKVRWEMSGEYDQYKQQLVSPVSLPTSNEERASVPASMTRPPGLHGPASVGQEAVLTRAWTVPPEGAHNMPASSSEQSLPTVPAAHPCGAAWHAAGISSLSQSAATTLGELSDLSRKTSKSVGCVVNTLTTLGSLPSLAFGEMEHSLTMTSLPPVLLPEEADAHQYEFGGNMMGMPDARGTGARNAEYVEDDEDAGEDDEDDADVRGCPNANIEDMERFATKLTPWEACATCFHSDLVNGKPIYLSQLNNLYKLRSGNKELEYRSVGYDRLGEFLATIPGLIVAGKAKSMTLEVDDLDRFEDFVDTCIGRVSKRMAEAKKKGLDTRDLDIKHFRPPAPLPRKILDRIWVLFNSLEGREITASSFLSLYREVYAPDKLRYKALGYQDSRGFMAQVPFVVNVGRRRSGKYALRQGATWSIGGETLPNVGPRGGARSSSCAATRGTFQRGPPQPSPSRPNHEGGMVSL